ncbi:hypothetical protein AURDEDRAFT_167130 [Auricularia subglabra TFB-10046 SS5]|nr:hypothetical protein AURDEDRAFT_167130 [Auricularia subglabra TFB-10046 SS5]
MVLNDDLVEEISRYLSKSAIAALCSSSRGLSVVLTNQLYHTIDLHELSTPSVFRLFSTIESSRNIASLVRIFLHIDVLHGLADRDPTAYTAALSSALTRLHNLRKISCYNLETLIAAYPAIAGTFPTLRSMRDVTFVGSEWSAQAQTQVLAALHPLLRLVFHVGGDLLEERGHAPSLQAVRVPGLEQLLRTSCESLEHLELHGVRLSEFLNEAPLVAFKGLISLSIRSEEPLEDVWASSFPHLERLTLLNLCDERLNLISIPGSLPELSYLGFCFEGFELPRHPERVKPMLPRRIAHLTIHGSIFPTLEEDRVVFIISSVIQTDSLKSLQIDGIVHHLYATVEGVLGFCSNLEFFSLYAHAEEVEDALRAVSMHAPPSLRVLSVRCDLRFTHWSMPIEGLDTLVSAQLPALPLTLELLELRLYEGVFRLQPALMHFRRCRSSWVQTLGDELRPLEEFCWRIN